MKLIAERSDILPAIQRVAGIVNRVNVSAVLGNILMDAGPETVTVRANNLDMEATATFPATVSEQGRITLQAATMLDAIKSLPLGTDVQIVHGQDDPRAKLSSGRSRFNIPSLPADMFPSFPDMKGNEITLSAASLKAGLDMVSFAMSREATRYYICSVLLHLKDGQLIAVATDGNRLAEAIIGTHFGEFSALIPSSMVTQLVATLEGVNGDVTISAGGGLIGLDAGNIVLNGKAIDGNFPDYQRVIPKTNQHRLSVGRDAFIAAIRRAMIMGDGKVKSVRLDLTSDSLSVQGRAPDSGEAVDEISAEWRSDPLRMQFNGGFLIDALSKITDDTATFEIADEMGPVLMREGGAAFVIMPQRG